jgi:hypothetical protein
MEKIRIKCPVCGILLEADDNPANYEKHVLCPNCKTRNKFSAFKRVVPVAPEEEDCTTVIREIADDAVGALVDVATGRSYPLREGRNLVGRMTYNSPPAATVPIVTENRKMSRSHLYIHVMRGADGRYHAYASNASNRNATTINGTVLEDGDMISLRYQDVLSLADTRLVYTGGKVNDETEIRQK